MASIHREVILGSSVDVVWDALRDIGALHTRLVPGFVTDTKLEERARIVTFANGMVARELIIDVDENRRRVAWAVAGSEMLSHYSASFQLFDAGGGRTRGVWIADLLPHEAASAVTTMIEEGLRAMARAFG